MASTVEFHFKGDSSQFTREAAKAQKALERTGAIAEKSSKQASGGYTKLKAALVGAGIVAFAETSAHAFLDEQVATAKLQNTLKNNPQLAHASEKGFEDLARSISYKTAADRESITSGIAVLGQFKLNEQQLKEITPLVVDYARKTGRDVPDAASAIGKALLGNARALKSIGINFKATGDAGKDYGTILGLLKSKVGGYAAEEEKSRHGIDVMQHRFHDLQVEIGGKLLSSFDFLIRNFKVLGPVIITIGTAIATVKIAKFAKELSGAISAIRTGFATAATKGINLFGGSLAGLASILGPAAVLAAAFGATAYVIGKAHQDAKEKVQNFTQALLAEQAGSKGAVAQLVLQRLETAGLLGQLQKAGLTVNDFVGALQQQPTALARVAEGLNSLGGKVTNYAFVTDVATGATVNARTKALPLAYLLEELGNSYDGATTAAKQHTTAEGQIAGAISNTGTKAKAATVTILGMTQTDFKAWAATASTNLNFVSGDLSKLGGAAKLSAADVLKAFTDELTAMANYKTNFDTILRRNAPADLLKQLADMGEQGAPIVAALAHANTKQFNAIIGKWNAARGASKGVTSDIARMARSVTKSIQSIPNHNITLGLVVTPALKAAIAASGRGTVLKAEVLRFQSGGPVPGLPGQAQAAIVHGGEYVLSRQMLKALGQARAKGGDGVSAKTVVYDDHSTVIVHNPVPEKLSETLPAWHRRKQLLRGH